MSCECDDPVIHTDTRQINEDERQVTTTCLRCGLVENTIEVIRQW